MTNTMSPLRVVLAEDDPDMRALLGAIIAGDEALELVAATPDAEAAIEAARAHQPDVCVLDVAMPRGGGPHAARGIRAACPATRLVVLSGRDDRRAGRETPGGGGLWGRDARATVVEMLRAGAAGYVVKGASPAEIVDTVRRTARGEWA